MLTMSILKRETAALCHWLRDFLNVKGVSPLSSKPHVIIIWLSPSFWKCLFDSSFFLGFSLHDSLISDAKSPASSCLACNVGVRAVCMDVCACIHARRARKLTQVPNWQSVTAETKFSPVNGNRGFYEEYNLLMPAIYKVKRNSSLWFCLRI